MTVTVRPVALGRAARPFIDVLWRVYEDDPIWVPPLRRTLREQLDPKMTPFLRYGRAQLFIAERDGEAVGRISAHVNPLHNERWNERAGFFGFFECIDDAEVAGALFEAAEHWLDEEEVDFVRGPVSFTLNEEAGCLVDGFDRPAQVAMPHGRPYYAGLIDGAGYTKAKDLWAYRYDVGILDERRQRAYDLIHAMPNVHVREFEKKHLKRDVRLAVEIFNDAWQQNWGFVPVTVEEADRLAENLIQFADPGLTVMVEIDGEPAAMVLGIPNVQEAARDINGRLFPFGWAKLLWRLHRGLESGRVILLGVKRKYRRREFAQLPVMLTAEINVRGAQQGYHWAELGWVLEDNTALAQLVRRTNARVYKTYRIFEKQRTAAAP